MVTITSIVGSIDNSPVLAKEYRIRSKKKQVESITINRLESQRARMRKRSDKGTDIIITLNDGLNLRHNDVLLLDDTKMILVKREPENVAILDIKRNDIELAIRIGHALGNLHRPIKVEGNSIIFPIQSDGEIEMVRKLLHLATDSFSAKKAMMVFEPEEGMDVHGH